MISPTFRQLRDGRVMVEGRFPASMAITREMLEYAHPGVLGRRWRTVTFGCVNATAVYRLMRRGPFSRCYMLQRVSPA